MCNPAFIAIGVQAATSVVGGFQQAQQYKAQSRAYSQQAQSEAISGAYNARRQEAANNQQIDSMRSGYLSNGIALEGSANTTIENSARQASLDEQAIKYDANMRADNSRFEARLAKANAGNAVLGGFLSAAGSVASGYAGWQNQQDQRTLLQNPYLGYAS